MLEYSEEWNAAVKSGASKRRSSIRSVFHSLARRIHIARSGVVGEQDVAEACHAPRQPMNRIVKQGCFDWGSFSAFEDGSLEVERAGVKQRFRSFSELKRSLKGP